MSPDLNTFAKRRHIITRTGYKPEEVIGRNCVFTSNQNQIKKELDRLKSHIRNQESCEITTTNHDKAGEEF
jgi:uncharacterized protein YicC (UPF0701 family)